MDARFLQTTKVDPDDLTLYQAMFGFVIPVFVDLIWFLSWVMIAVKSMGGNLTNGRGGGWCRMFCLILCVFQSFYGFCVVHSIVQPWSLVLMLFPVIGFFGFSGNHPVWLISYARALSKRLLCAIAPLLPPSFPTRTLLLVLVRVLVRGYSSML